MGGTRAKLAHVDGHFDPPSLSYATASNRGLHELAGPPHGCGHLHSRFQLHLQTRHRITLTHLEQSTAAGQSRDR